MPKTTHRPRAPRAGITPITRGSGNVFADLELSGADELLAKADLAIAVTRNRLPATAGISSWETQYELIRCRERVR